jgi:hypothetical protein
VPRASSFFGIGRLPQVAWMLADPLTPIFSCPAEADGVRRRAGNALVSDWHAAVKQGLVPNSFG